MNKSVYRSNGGSVCWK